MELGIKESKRCPMCNIVAISLANINGQNACRECRRAIRANKPISKIKVDKDGIREIHNVISKREHALYEEEKNKRQNRGK